jgi:hypothetical protein
MPMSLPLRRRRGAMPREGGAHLGSNCRHLGDLKRLSRFSRLDAQSAERKRRWESLPYGLRDVALGWVVAFKRGVDVRLRAPHEIAVAGLVRLVGHQCPTKIRIRCVRGQRHHTMTLQCLSTLHNEPAFNMRGKCTLILRKHSMQPMLHHVLLIIIVCCTGTSQRMRGHLSSYTNSDSKL